MPIFFCKSLNNQLIDIRPSDLKTICQILALYIQSRDVWAFGSRVNGTARPTSDLDLVIMGQEPVALRTMAMLRDAFSESDLPMKIDILDWATTSEEFRNIIEQNKVLVTKGNQ